MQNGIILGIYSIFTFASFIVGLTAPLFSMANLVMMVNFPLFAIFLTARFRRSVAPNFPFSFARGFSHTLLCVLYAGIWAGVGTFVYFYFIDQGYMADVFQARFDSPDFQAALKQTGYDKVIAESGNGMTPKELIALFRETSAANFAALTIYIYVLSAPLVAVLGGLFNIRRNKRF